MNLNNIVRLDKLYSVLVEIIGNSGTTPTLRINLPALGVTGVAAPPYGFKSEKFSASTLHTRDAKKIFFEEVDASCAIAAQALDTLGQMGEVLAASAKDLRMSDVGRHEKIVAAVTEAMASIGKHYAELSSIKASLETQKTDFYAAPEPDAAAAAIDVEVRARFNQLAEIKQLQITAKLDASAEYARLLLALRRAAWPFEGVVGKAVETAWAATVMNQNPKKAAALQIAVENNDWAVALVTRLAQYIANPNVSGSTGSLDRFSLYKILRTTGGADVLSFTPNEVIAFERRILQAAA